jgi:hypothetical protein
MTRLELIVPLILLQLLASRAGSAQMRSSANSEPMQLSRQEISDLETKVRPRLLVVQNGLSLRLQKLMGSRSWSKEELASELSEAEKDISGALSDDRLRPLRSAAVNSFASARKRLAAFGGAAKEVIWILGEIQDLVARLLQIIQQEELGTTICVTAEKPGFASFTLRSKEPDTCSTVEGRRFNLATGRNDAPGSGSAVECSHSEAQNTWNLPVEIRSLVRGNYQYLASSRGFDEIACGWEAQNAPDCLQLLDNGVPQLLVCDFVRGSCTQQRLSPGGCHAYIAATLAGGFRELLAEFRRKRAALHLVGAGNEYRLREIDQLLNGTEEPLLALLHGDEMAALRDSVRLTFLRIRYDVSKADKSRGQRESGATSKPRIMPASLTPEAGDDQNVLKSIIDPLLDVVDQLLSRLTGMSDAHNYTTSLCVISRPAAGAIFHMRPAEFHNGARTGVTTYEFTNLPRGRYTYSVESGSRTFQCGWEKGEGDDLDCIDLWNHSNQLIECDLEKGTCKQRDPRGGECTAR